MIFGYLSYSLLKEINQHLFSIKFGLYTLIAAAITYPLIKYAVRNDWLILIAFAFHIVIIVAVIAWLEISVYKYESFSFINLILTPFTFFILFVHFQIEIKPTLVIQKVTKAPAVINNLRVGENTYYVRLAYHQDNYFQLSFSDKAPYLWHGIKVNYLTNADFLGKLETDKYSGEIGEKYNYLRIKSTEDVIIHNRLCSHKSSLYFRFLTKNYQDWSEENTEFEHCKLVDNSPLNQMSIFNDLGDNVRLYYKPFENTYDHPRFLYESPIFSSEIKWYWEVDKKVRVFPEFESNIVGLYLDNNKHLLAIHMYNFLYNDETIKIGNCELTADEFKEILIVNVGNDPVTALFPRLSYRPECSDVQLAIAPNLIFDNVP